MVSDSERDHLVRDMGGILKMMTKRSNGIFRRRRPVWESWRPEGGIADRRSIERKRGILRQLVIVERGQFHEEVMRMLSVNNWAAVSRLSLLEQLRVAAARDRRRLQAQHGSPGQSSFAERSLRHWHEPIRGKEFVRATRACLLKFIHENLAVKHQHPLALVMHDHFERRGVRLCIGSRRRVLFHRCNQRMRLHVHLV